MDSSLYMPSRKVLAALGATAPAAAAAPVAFSVKETSPLRANFLAGRGFAAAAPAEGGSIAMYSPAFYAACTVGGIASCGLTHTMVTPLDIVKCNMQARTRARAAQRAAGGGCSGTGWRARVWEGEWRSPE